MISVKTTIDKHSNYNFIEVKKFYQVVFINPDSNSLDIYTCIIFRPYESKPKNDLAKKSAIVDPNTFSLNICIESNYPGTTVPSDGKSVVSSFSKNPEPWRKMWGQDCELQLGNYNGPKIDGLISNLAKRIFDVDEITSKKIRDEGISEESDKKTLAFERLGLRSIVDQNYDSNAIDPFEAQPSETSTSNSKINNSINQLVGGLKDQLIVLSPDINEFDADNVCLCLPATETYEINTTQCEYAINPASTEFDGRPSPALDQISWTKVSIPFNSSKILKSKREEGTLNNFEYSLKFDGVEPGSKRENKYQVNDLKIYLVCPPYLSFSESAEIKASGTLRGENPPPTKNALDEMVKQPAAYFDDWINNQNILNRRIYRVRSKVIDSKYNFNSFTLTADLKREKIPWDFIISFIVPLLLAFGMDSGRLTAYTNLFDPQKANIAIKFPTWYQNCSFLSWLDGKYPLFFANPTLAWLIIVTWVVSHLLGLKYFVTDLKRGEDQFFPLLKEYPNLLISACFGLWFYQMFLIEDIQFKVWWWLALFELSWVIIFFSVPLYWIFRFFYSNPEIYHMRNIGFKLRNRNRK